MLRTPDLRAPQHPPPSGRAARTVLTLSLGLVLVLGLSPPVEGEQKIYWTVHTPADREVWRADADGTDSEMLLSGLVGPNGIALDPAAGKMYWAEQNGHRIVRANLDGTGTEAIVQSLPGFPADVALDVAAGKVYWVEFAGTTTFSVKRANLDGTGVEDLVPLDQSGNRNGIALDLVAGKIYWTLCAGIIRRANLDGSGVEDLLTGLGCLVDVEIDAHDGKMYWTEADAGTPRLLRADLDGSGVEELLTTELDSPREIALDLDSGRIYLLDSGAQKILRSNLDGSGVVELVSDLEGGWGLALDPTLTVVFADGFESGDTTAWSSSTP